MCKFTHSLPLASALDRSWSVDSRLLPSRPSTLLNSNIALLTIGFAAQSPGDRFTAIEITDGWNATVKPLRSVGSRDPPSTQISPSGLTPITPDSYGLSNTLSPRLHPGSRLADSKSHNRQTSIVHGVQHSRNGSLASNSPLSPALIAAAGAKSPDVSGMGDLIFASTMSSVASATSFSSSTTLVADRTSPAADGYSLTQKRLERMHSGSGKTRRDHAHHPSTSRHHYKEELKTVGEYALHVLFTSVSLPTTHAVFR